MPPRKHLTTKVKTVVCAVALLTFSLLLIVAPDKFYTASQAATSTYSGSITTASPNYPGGRPAAADSTCSPNSLISTSVHPYYHAYNFTVDTTGTYRMVQDSNTFNTALANDGMFFLYSGDFSSTAPITNLIAKGDGNGGCTRCPVITCAVLTAGVSYTLVTTPKDQGAIGDFQNTICASTDGSACDGSGNVVPDALSTIVVNSTADTDDGACTAVGTGNGCTLREAIKAANTDIGTETITFDPTVFASAQTIYLPNGLPTITTSMNIVGPGESLLTLRGRNPDDTGGGLRPFTVETGSVVIEGMTISGASTFHGGGIFNFATLTLSHVTFTDNTAASTTSGGAIRNDGTLTVDHGTFTGNTSGNSGGAIVVQGGVAIVRNSIFTNNTTNTSNPAAGGGAIYTNLGTKLTVIDSSFVGNSVVGGGNGGGIMVAGNTAVAAITNSTFSGNSATGGGGVNTAQNVQVTITNSTITNNSGGGIRKSSGGTLTLRNSIVANSTGDFDCLTTGTAPTFANSLVEDGTCGVVAGVNGNKTGDPLLGTLTDGSYPLTVLSPARDAGDNNWLSEATTGVDYNGDGDTTDTLTTDQTGANRIRGTTVDMGSTELFFRDFVVDRTDDATIDGCTPAPNDCSLRAAIDAANAVDGTQTITFDGAVFGSASTIQLDSALPEIATSMNITGPGARLLSVRGDGGSERYRIFTIQSGATVNISGLTVTNGAAPNGGTGLAGQDGGGINNSGTLTLTGVTVSGNRAGNGGSSTTGAPGGNGGGISNSGTLTISKSTINGNVAGAGGLGLGFSGPAGFGGGIRSTGTLTVTNSTISGNATAATSPDLGSGNGGGISIDSSKPTTITNSTITANTSFSFAAGMRIEGSAVATVSSTIIALNAGQAPEIFGLVQSGGFNLISTPSSGFVQPTDIVGNPQINALANNGGPTDTHSLQVTSPAIDKGNSFGSTTDQRGLSRHVDFMEVGDATGGNGSDIGAYEAQVNDSQIATGPLVVNTTGDAADTDTTDGLCDTDAATAGQQCSLRAAIQEANARLGANVINFDPAVFASPGPYTIQLTSALPDLGTDIMINGVGRSVLAVSGEGAADRYRIFTVTPGAAVKISGLTITNGYGTDNPGFRGGGIQNAGVLTLTSVTVSNNRTGDVGNFGSHGVAAGSGGGIQNTSSGTLTLLDAIVTGNRTGNGGNAGAPGSSGGDGGLGGGINNEGTLTVINSSISGNQTGGGGSGTSVGDGGSGGGICSIGVVKILNSTLTGNLARGNGGAIQMLLAESNLTLINTTISGNNANENAGGVDLIDGPAIIINTTITNNRADADVSGTSGVGGGLRANVGPTLHNTLVARNFISGATDTDSDINGPVGSTSSNNLIGVDTGIAGGVTNGTSGNKIGTAASPLNPRLGPLANNGGLTLTHALLPGSPAFDSGASSNIPADSFDLDGNGDTAERISVDQRGAGFPRILDSADAGTTKTVDIGALESNPSVEDITDKSTAEDTALPQVTFNVGDSSLIASVTAESSNTTLIPNVNILVAGSGATRTLNITPAANANSPQDGTATITVTVTATNGATAVDTFVVTVSEVNDAPVPTNDIISDVAADSGVKTIPFASLLANDTNKGAPNENGQTLNITAVGNAAGGTVAINGTNVEFTPAAGFSGPASFTYTVTDNGTTNGVSDPKSGTATVNFNVVAVVPNISIVDSQLVEPSSGSANMIFTVALSKPALAGGASVTYTTQDQTAVAGQDYTFTSGMLNFNTGEQIKTFVVPVLSDANNSEPNETFLVNLSAPVNGVIVDGTATGTILIADRPGTILISELRMSGPGGAGDDFVEIYNNSDSPVTVAASDASAGWGLYMMGADCSATPVLIGVIPNGTIIPARGHYLFVGSAYSLASYATGDQTLISDIESDANVALFNTSAVTNLSPATRLDAVGFGSNTGGVCDLLREGPTLTPLGGSVLEHSYVRDECGKKGNPDYMGVCLIGYPKDTNDNFDNFFFVDTTGTATPAGKRLGAPGPQNSGAPATNNAVTGLLLDGNQTASAAPNRVRDLTPVTNGANGTMSIRRRFVNNTGESITQLRFRIVDISSMPGVAGGADIRALTSSNVTSGTTDPGTCAASGFGSAPCSVTVSGTTLDTPSQSLGGAFNSSMSTGTVTLAPGASVNLQFLLGVQQSGSFKFYINVEALTSGSAPPVTRTKTRGAVNVP